MDAEDARLQMLQDRISAREWKPEERGYIDSGMWVGTRYIDLGMEERGWKTIARLEKFVENPWPVSRQWDPDHAHVCAD
jgi:hypothetical protein